MKRRYDCKKCTSITKVVPAAVKQIAENCDTLLEEVLKLRKELEECKQRQIITKVPADIQQTASLSRAIELTAKPILTKEEQQELKRYQEKAREEAKEIAEKRKEEMRSQLEGKISLKERVEQLMKAKQKNPKGEMSRTIGKITPEQKSVIEKVLAKSESSVKEIQHMESGAFQNAKDVLRASQERQQQSKPQHIRQTSVSSRVFKPQEQSTLPAGWESDTKYVKYQRMKKAGVPDEAILNAMQRDGINPPAYGRRKLKGKRKINAKRSSYGRVTRKVAKRKVAKRKVTKRSYNK